MRLSISLSAGEVISSNHRTRAGALRAARKAAWERGITADAPLSVDEYPNYPASKTGYPIAQVAKDFERWESRDMAGRFHHVEDLRIRGLLESPADPISGDLEYAVQAAIKAALADVDNPEVPGKVADRRCQDALMAERLLRPNNPANRNACKEELRRFWAA